MKKIILKLLLIITIILIVLIIAFIILLVIINLSYKPESDRYVYGRTYVNPIELMNSKFSFKTYDSNLLELRREEINIYCLGKFLIDFNENEKYFFVYKSYYSSSKNDMIVSEYIDVYPEEIFDIDKFNKRFFKYKNDIFSPKWKIIY